MRYLFQNVCGMASKAKLCTDYWDRIGIQCAGVVETRCYKADLSCGSYEFRKGWENCPLLEQAFPPGGIAWFTHKQPASGSAPPKAGKSPPLCSAPADRKCPTCCVPAGKSPPLCSAPADRKCPTFCVPAGKSPRLCSAPADRKCPTCCVPAGKSPSPSASGACEGGASGRNLATDGKIGAFFASGDLSFEGKRQPSQRVRRPGKVLRDGASVLGDEDPDRDLFDEPVARPPSKANIDHAYVPADEVERIRAKLVAEDTGRVEPDPRVVRNTSRLVQWRDREDACWVKDGNLFIGTVYRNPGADLHSCLAGLTKDIYDCGGCVVLYADFNVHMEANGDAVSDEGGRTLKRWCRAMNLEIVNLMTDRVRGQFSRVQVKISKETGEVKVERTTPDYVLVSSALKDSVVELALDASGQFSSDHKPLVLTLRRSRPPAPLKKRNDSHKAWRKPKTAEQMEQFRNAIDDRMTKFLRGSAPVDEVVDVFPACSASTPKTCWLRTRLSSTGCPEYLGRRTLHRDGGSKSWLSAKIRSMRSDVDMRIPGGHGYQRPVGR